jgi:cation diffusion facilitator CzcD-associated flavoprotein CzcO
MSNSNLENDSLNKFFPLMIGDSPEQAFIADAFKQMMAARLNSDEELIGKIVPDYPVGCRRLTPGNGYLEALQQDNAGWDFDLIIRITEHGIETSKGIEEFDIIVCASGFDVSFKPLWNVVVGTFSTFTLWPSSV